MELKDTNTFCWAMRHSLMDSVLLEIYHVEDRVGVSEFIKEMSELDLMEVIESCSDITNQAASQLLEFEYHQFLQEQAGDSIIYESAYDCNQNISNYLSESEIGDRRSADEIIKIARSSGFTFALSAYILWAMKDSKAAFENRKYLSDKLGSKWNAMMNSSPRLKRLLDPGKYEKDRLLGLNKTKIKKLRKVIKNTKSPNNKKLAQTELDNIINAANNSAQKAADKTKMGRIHNKIKSVKDKIHMSPEEADRLRLKRKASKIKSKNPKRILIFGGLIAAGALAYSLYKYTVDDARKHCKSMKGKDKSKCILQYKIDGANIAIQTLTKSMDGCSSRADPDQCRYSITRKIWAWKQRLSKYENRLDKLIKKQREAATKKQLRINKKAVKSV